MLGATALVSAVFVLGYFVILRQNRRLREQEELAQSLARREDLRVSLLNQDWIMTFEPKMPHGKKRIKFFADGTVGEGKNPKETTWEIDGEELVIWRENGDFQNRFRFDDLTDRFVSTGDPSAGAVKEGHLGQSVSRAPVPA